MAPLHECIRSVNSVSFHGVLRFLCVHVVCTRVKNFYLSIGVYISIWRHYTSALVRELRDFKRSIPFLFMGAPKETDRVDEPEPPINRCDRSRNRVYSVNQLNAMRQLIVINSVATQDPQTARKE